MILMQFFYLFVINIIIYNKKVYKSLHLFLHYIDQVIIMVTSYNYILVVFWI